MTLLKSLREVRCNRAVILIRRGIHTDLHLNVVSPTMRVHNAWDNRPNCLPFASTSYEVRTNTSCVLFEIWISEKFRPRRPEFYTRRPKNRSPPLLNLRPRCSATNCRPSKAQFKAAVPGRFRRGSLLVVLSFWYSLFWWFALRVVRSSGDSLAKWHEQKRVHEQFENEFTFFKNSIPFIGENKEWRTVIALIFLFCFVLWTREKKCSSCFSPKRIFCRQQIR